MVYYLLTGSNIGDSIAVLKQAEEELSKEIGKVVQASSYYKTAPWGFEAEQDFINQALILHSELTPDVVLDKCLEIEKRMGRIRYPEKEGYQSRVIDIDIIFAETRIIHNDKLTLPHPRMHERRFVLKPLAEIAGDFIHPSLHKNMTDLLAVCSDSSEVLPVLSW